MHPNEATNRVSRGIRRAGRRRRDWEGSGGREECNKNERGKEWEGVTKTRAEAIR
jgi:hypothetical protein